MSDDVIRVGDIVVKVRACTPAALVNGYGIPWRVARIGFWRCDNCKYCGKSHPGLFGIADTPFNGGRATGAPISWLKKINPPPVKVETQEEEHA